VRLGKEGAPEALGIENCKSINNFNTELEGLLTGSKNIYLSAFHENKITKLVYKQTNELWQRRKKQDFIPAQVIHIDHIIEKQRLVKDPSEIELMRKSAQITERAHLACMSYCGPGKNERDIDGCLQFFFRKDGGSGEAYSSIVASGNNANILHYIENDSELKDGDLILIDAGSEFNLYDTDVTRTFPVNGTFSNEQKEIYQVVLDAQVKTIEASKPGVKLSDLHEIAQRELIKGLIGLNILTGSVEDILSSEKHRKYYPHGTGHWLGLDVHDQCPYLDENNEGIELAEGMYFTVEPGLYFNENDLTVPSKYRGIGVRIEDDILITNNGYEVLTKGIPKTVEAVEKACREGFDSFIK
jgi:Xaa-Pro aminopeptidase